LETFKEQNESAMVWISNLKCRKLGEQRFENRAVEEKTKKGPQIDFTIFKNSANNKNIHIVYLIC
jgi:hypothetical protein